MKTTINGYVIGYNFDSMKSSEIVWTFGNFTTKPVSDRHMVHCFPDSFEVDTPDHVDIVSAQIDALNAEKQRAMDMYQASVREINDRLSKLQALTYVAHQHEGVTS